MARTQQTQQTFLEWLQAERLPHTVSQADIWASYVSGEYRDYFATEAEAETHAVELGCEFNGVWFDGRTAKLEAGTLVVWRSHVYLANYQGCEAIAHIKEMPAGTF